MKTNLNYLIYLSFLITLISSIQIKDQLKTNSKSTNELKNLSQNKQCPCSSLFPSCCTAQFETVSIIIFILVYL